MAILKQYWIWFAIAGLLVLVVVINKDKFFPSIKPLTGGKLPNGKGNVPVGTPSTGGGYTGITATNLKADMWLQEGSTGPEVTELQHLLNAADSAQPIGEDGIFGPATHARLRKVMYCDTTTLGQAWTFFNEKAQTKAYLNQILGFTTTN